MRGQPGCSLPTFDRAAAILTSRLRECQRVFCSRLSEAHRRSALGARGVIAQARQEMGAKSSPARAQEARANAKADRRSGGPAGAPCRAHQEGLPKVWAEICSQPNQSAISGSFFGTKYWKCAESDDGNPKKSMILHRMVPSDTAKSVELHLSLPPLPNSAFWRPFRTQEVRPGAAVAAPR